MSTARRIDVTVERDALGALGLDVNSSNTIMGCQRHSTLQVGDVILAVNGATLDGSTHVKQLLHRDEASFTLRVERAAVEPLFGLAEEVFVCFPSFVCSFRSF